MNINDLYQSAKNPGRFIYLDVSKPAGRPLRAWAYECDTVMRNGVVIGVEFDPCTTYQKTITSDKRNTKNARNDLRVQMQEALIVDGYVMSDEDFALEV